MESAPALENRVQEDRLWNSRVLCAVGKEGMIGRLEFEDIYMGSILPQRLMWLTALLSSNLFPRQ